MAVSHNRHIYSRKVFKELEKLGKISTC
ncbi:hypothetical protein [Conchiformibius steedae]